MNSQGADPAATFPSVVREPPLYDKVADMMLKEIVSRRFQPGDRLPSERELGEQFGVSRTVVREAVKALTAKAHAASTARSSGSSGGRASNGGRRCGPRGLGSAAGRPL